MIAERSANNLVLRVEGTEDSITVSNYFYDVDGVGSYLVNEIRFTDGTNWDVAAIKQLTVRETDGNDVIYGYAEDNVFDGLAGDDEIHGGGGNDQLTSPCCFFAERWALECASFHFLGSASCFVRNL